MGPNLFHSFATFSIGAHDTAQFATNTGLVDTTIGNILSRVTGTNPSNLFGTLETKSYFPTANFFLINPNGIVFGPNASINVGGSANFVAGDYLRMGDTKLFFASPSHTTTLSIAAVSAFGFLAATPLASSMLSGSVEVQGGTVANSSALTLVGRDIPNIGGPITPGIVVRGGTLSNPSGDIRLVSVGAPANPAIGGEVTAQTLAPVSSQGFTSLGSIEVTNGGVISTSPTPGLGPFSSGGIVIRTGKLTVNDGKLLTDTKGPFFSSNKFVTGTIEVHADTVVLNLATISTTAQSSGTQAGNIDFSDIGSLTAKDSIFTTLTQATNARIGDIKIGSAHTSVIDLTKTDIGANHGIEGTPGSIQLSANSIALHKGSVSANTADNGPGGTIRLNGSKIDISGSELQSSDNLVSGSGGGSIILEGLSSTASVPTRANQVVIRDGATLSTASSSGSGGGGVTIRAANALVDGATVRTESKIIRSGPILIDAEILTLQNAATLSTSPVLDPSSPNIRGAGGLLTIQANALNMSGKSDITSSTNSQGVGGNINISSQNISMSDGARIDASTSGPGDAGKINISSGLIAGDKSTFISSGSTENGLAGNLTLHSPTSLTIRGMNIQTTSSDTSGGNIKLTAPNIIRLVDSTLSSSVEGQAGSNGGNITIDPQLVVIQNSQLLANANAGAGGNITIAASGAVLVDPNSLLSATAGPAGVSGSVNINAPIQVLSGALVPLNLTYSQAGLSGDRCAADPTGQFSSFVQAGRDGVPQVPGALSPSPLSFLDTLTSGSWESQGPNWAATRLGLDFVSVNNSTLYQFHSACRS